MPQVAIFSWHPTDSPEMTAGGFLRAYEVVKRTPYRVTLFDKYPSVFKDLRNSNVSVIEYRTLCLKFLDHINPLINRILDRLTTPFFLTLEFIKCSNHWSAIYVPYSELPQLTLSGVIAKILSGQRLILTNLNPNSIYLDRIFNSLLHRFSNSTITISSNLSKQLNTTGISVNYINGVGFESPTSEPGENNKIYDAVYIGRHTPEKGILDLIEIWNILINRMNYKFKLITMGEIPVHEKSKIISQIMSYNLQNYIHLIGPVSNQNKINYLAKSKVCVFPSYQEGWGIVPMEALSMGIPVIAYNLSVYQESIGKSKYLITVNTGDTLKFAKKIVATLSDLPKKVIWKPLLTWDIVASREWQIICNH